MILKGWPLENLWLLGLELQQFAQLRGPLKPVIFCGDVDGLLIPGVTYWFPGLNQFKSKKIREKNRTIHEKTGKSGNLWHGGYSFSYSWGIFVYKSRISMRGVPWTGPLEGNSCLSVEEIIIFISEIMWDNYIKLLYLLTYCINYRVFFPMFIG